MLVNNAGWDVFKPFTKTEPAQWDKLIAINLIGALHMHHAVLPGMVARRQGRIVNIASDAARVGSSGEAVYAACKGGLVVVLQDHRARACAPRHHRQRGLPGADRHRAVRRLQAGRRQPREAGRGLHAAPIPLGRIGQPDDLPGAILFFASDDAAYVTGQVLSVSGGLTMDG